MLHLWEVLVLVALLAAPPGSGAPPGRPPPLRAPAGGAPPLGQGRALAAGESCGVYTLSCAQGLRCVPPLRHHSPLQALLQGRGVCTKLGPTGPTQSPVPAGPLPSQSGELEKAPCRKLLNSVLRQLDLMHFPSNQDIYIPNCDTRGFYRKKQCRSSKGLQRGLCWCVDEQGTPLPNTQDGPLPCDGK